MDADTTRTRAMLVGVWAVQAGGIHSQLSLNEDGTYINLLAGGMQSHWGKWSVVANMLHFVLDGAAPQTWVGPLGAVPIRWPTSESWGLVHVADDFVQIAGGTMVRSQPRPQTPHAPHAPTAPTGPGGPGRHSTAGLKDFTKPPEGPPAAVEPLLETMHGIENARQPGKAQAAFDEFMKQ